MAGAKAAVGTVFKIGNTAVGLLKSIGGLDCSADTIDVTTLDSTDGWREFINGFKDGGEVPLSGFYDSNEGQDLAWTNFGGAAVSCSITFPTTISANWAFNGVVTKFATGAEVEGAVSFDAVVKVSGKPTLNS